MHSESRNVVTLPLAFYPAPYRGAAFNRCYDLSASPAPTIFQLQSTHYNVIAQLRLLSAVAGRLHETQLF